MWLLPMSEKKKEDTETQGQEGRQPWEDGGRTGVMWPQAKGCLERPESGRDEKGPPCLPLPPHTPPASRGREVWQMP
jgi:hypothetical protein